jgi:hypothetical protein
MEGSRTCGNQFHAIIRRIGNPPRASEGLPNRVEVIDLIGVPGGIRTLVCAVKERALEVIRIYRGLVDDDASLPESNFAFYLEESALVTLGVCYERVPRFGGGAYHSILRRLEEFFR